jgi:hypothetical protein
VFPNGFISAAFSEGFCRKRVQILAAILIIAFFMNDWRITSEDVVNGQIFYQSSINMLYMAILGLNYFALKFLKPVEKLN